MILNNLKIAFRNLSKNSLYAALNISGLAIGVSACLLILLFVANEFSYDRWNPLAERIVRPTYEIKLGGFDEHYACVDALVGPEAAAELPQIETWCRIHQGGSPMVRREGEPVQNNRMEKVLLTDSSFFDVFPLHLAAGNARNSLNQPHTAAISCSLATRYFSDPQKALGQMLLLENKDRQQISAVFEDIPANSHFHADVLVSLTGNEQIKNAPQYWGVSNNWHTYFLLRQGVDKAAFAEKFGALASDKVSLFLKDMFATTPADFEKAGQRARFNVQNLKDIHLYSELTAELEPNGSIKYVWIFSAIAFFILLIACINFMNLSTARSAGRAREVGVRKVLGSTRSALAGQFLTESLALSAIAMLLAVGLAAAALPAFRELSGRAISMPWGEPVFWTSLFGGTLVVGLLAGSYPAFFLSGFHTLQVLKKQVSRSGNTAGGLSFRNGLVVFQFAISTVLITTTMLVYKQLQYIQNKKLGFDKSQVLVLDNAYALGEGVFSLKEDMAKNAAVESATVTNCLPMLVDESNSILTTKRDYEAADKVMQSWTVDADYIRTLGMEISQGRDFDPARVTDSSAIILNETAARQLGLKDPIGQKLYTSTTEIVSPKPEDFTELTVVGVMKDFHFRSLRDNIGALYLKLGRNTGRVAFRIKGANTAPVIAALEQKWNDRAPDQPFTYRFLDDAYGKMYAAEQRIGKIALIFALLSALVSCLGLFGLASYITEQRTKEIGIRKVLGASVTGITALLAKDFLKLVLIGIVVAAPFTWYFMQQWLADFAYRIDIQWWVFVAAGTLAVLVAFFTVGFQSVWAALANPVKSLRSE